MIQSPWGQWVNFISEPCCVLNPSGIQNQMFVQKHQADRPSKQNGKDNQTGKNEERKWNRILVTNVGTSSSLDPSKTCSPPFKQLQVGISCQAHQMHLSMHLMFLCTCQWQLFGGTSKSCFVRDLGRFPLGREFLTQQEPNFSQQQKKQQMVP